jgi:hypothetical protein
VYENVLIQQFGTACIVNYDLNEFDLKGIALYRHSYSRELKLAAIEWVLNTYTKGKKDRDPNKAIIRYAAAKRLKITTTILRSWIRNRLLITSMKKGQRKITGTCNKRGKEH